MKIEIEKLNLCDKYVIRNITILTEEIVKERKEELKEFIKKFTKEQTVLTLRNKIIVLFTGTIIGSFIGFLIFKLILKK